MMGLLCKVVCKYIKRKRICMIYFIVNTTSGTGRGKKIWHEVRKELKNREVSFKAFETKYAGHATELAEKISMLKDDDICLVAVGGDGTVNEVLNGIKDFKRVRFATISIGSGNDFARGMKLPKDPIESLNQILEAAKRGKDHYEAIDLGKVQWYADSKKESSFDDGVLQEQKSRIFGISSGIGLDAIVCKEANDSKLKKILNRIKLGNLTYVLYTVYTLFKMRTMEVSMHLENANGTHIDTKMNKFIFMAVMNQFAEGGGVPMAPEAKNNDGLLSFSSASRIPKWRTFFCLPLLVAGKQKNIKGFEIIDGATATLKISEPVVLHTDGEYCGDVDEVTFTCLPGKLRYLREVAVEKQD